MMGRITFYQLYLICKIIHYLDSVIWSCSFMFLQPLRLLQHVVHGPAIEDNLETTTSPEYDSPIIVGG